MASKDQINANRKNSKKSTGPVTEEGKRLSSRNATRHGFTGQTVVLSPEEAEPYRKFTADFLKELAPASVQEKQLAQSIIDCRWRINQLTAIETAIYALGQIENAPQFSGQTPAMASALARAVTFTQKHKELDRIHRYQSRLHRQATQDQAALNQLQTARKLKEEDDFRDAAVLAAQHHDQDLPFDPADFGFIWSEAEIFARIDREIAIKAAHMYNCYPNVVNP